MENNIQNQQNLQQGQQAAASQVPPVPNTFSQVNQPAAVPPPQNKKGRGKGLLFGILILVLILFLTGGAYLAYRAGLFGKGSLNAVPATTMNTGVGTMPIATPTPTPVVVNNQQDVQNALNAVQSTDPSSMTQTLNQNATDSASFSQ